MPACAEAGISARLPLALRALLAGLSAAAEDGWPGRALGLSGLDLGEGFGSALPLIGEDAMRMASAAGLARRRASPGVVLLIVALLMSKRGSARDATLGAC